MRRELLVLITAFQISLIRPLKDSCDATGHRCSQMSESLEEEEKDNMGQNQGSKDKKVEVSFPQDLEGFGYKFNEDGKLRNIETDEPFKFEVKEGDRAYNQKHYEALGEVVTEYIYRALEEEVKLKRHLVPVDAKENESKSFFFMSDDAMTNDKLMILIHGSGVVRAGQWARRLIINDDLNSGTMLPYIKRATQEGYGVVITNGNENYVWKNKRRVPIRGSESPEKHFVYVWDNFISKAAAQTIVVVAHSYGGIVIVEGLQNCEGIMGRVKAIAFTDSVHSLAHQRADKKLRTWMKKNSCNWLSSDLPLDTPLEYKQADCELVSAGTTKHEVTSHAAFDSIFKFFDEKLRASNQTEPSENQVDTSDSQTDKSDSQTPMDTSGENPSDAVKNEMDTSENQAEASSKMKESSQTRVDATETQAEASCKMEESSQTRADATETQEEAPCEMEDSSQSQADVSQTQEEASCNKEDSSQTQTDATETQAEKSRMETVV